MKRDTAERFAAIAAEGVTLDQAQRIMQEFFAQIVRCPVCEGHGQITFSRNTQFSLAEHGRDDLEYKYIPAGTVGTCPRCGGDSAEGNGGYDPDYVASHCTKGYRTDDCRRDQQHHGEKDRRDDHAECGWRIMLPLSGSL